MGSRPNPFRSIVYALLGVVIGAALVAPASAHVTDRFGHLWTEHIKPKLATPGTLNAAGNPVHWTKLKAMPGGFADGVDNVGGAGGGGDITGVAAGTGLTGGGTTGDVSLAADTTYVQRRIGGTCPAGQAIFGVAADGTVMCETNAGFAGYKDGPVTGLDTKPSTVASLSLPAGKYIVFAKLAAENDTTDHQEIQCQLTAGADFDQAFGSLVDVGTISGTDTLSLMVAHEFTTAGAAVLNCNKGYPNPSTIAVFDIKIAAIALGSLSNVAFP